jgi:hypothetical protein
MSDVGLAVDYDLGDVIVSGKNLDVVGIDL